MLIAEGVKIPADGEIIKANDLCVDESSLTGEAEGVWKVTVEKCRTIRRLLAPGLFAMPVPWSLREMRRLWLIKLAHTLNTEKSARMSLRWWSLPLRCKNRLAAW